MKRILILLALVACAHPELVKADAAAQTAAAAGTGSSSNAGAQVKTGTEAQAATSTTVSVKRAPRHIALSVTPAADGGQPTFTLELDEGGDEIFASSTGTPTPAPWSTSTRARARPPMLAPRARPTQARKRRSSRRGRRSGPSRGW
jgi:hypothetical protein